MTSASDAGSSAVGHRGNHLAARAYACGRRRRPPLPPQTYRQLRLLNPNWPRISAAVTPSSSTISTSTKARVRQRRWPSAAPGSRSCRTTRPISIPPRWPSPSSKPSCERQKRAAMSTSGELSEISAASSHQTNAGTISRKQDMLHVSRPTL